MTVQAYIERFEYLARLYSPEVTKEWRCKKFEGGLKHELRKFLVPLKIMEFPVLVEQAKIVEQLETRHNMVARQQKAVSDSRSQKKPYNRPLTSVKKLQCYTIQSGQSARIHSTCQC